MVVNAFLRRGATVYTTQGKAFLFSLGFPSRNGYADATPLAFSTKVEDYD